MSYILVNNYRLDLKEDLPFPLNISLADIKDPSKRQRSHSKTIMIEGTANNLLFFHSCYSLSLTTIEGQVTSFNYDATSTYDAQYIKDEDERVYFSGSFQLLKAYINQGVITFEAVMFEKVVDVFQKWGDMMISELGWSEYDHVLTHSNIAASWDTYVRVNGVITNNFTAGLPDGFGYFYPLVDYGYDTNLNVFNDNDLVPHLYYREILIKALQFAGVNYSSNFIDSADFKKYIIGFGGGPKFNVAQAILDDRLVNITADLDFRFNQINGSDILGTRIFNSAGHLQIFANPPFTTVTVNNDVDGQYDISNGVITVANNGNYSFRISGSFDYDISMSGTGIKSINTTIDIGIVIDNNYYILGISTGTLIDEVAGTFTFDNTISLPLSSGQTALFALVFNSTGSIVPTVAGAYGGLELEIDFNNNVDCEMKQIDTVLLNGDTVVMSRYAPQIKVRDFVNGVIKHWNLYLSTPNVYGVIRIEPLDNFYLPTTVKDDWTHKIDYSKQVQIEPTAILQPKQYNFKFVADQDYFRKQYSEQYGINYGDRIVLNDAVFAQGNTDYQLPYTVSIPLDSDINDRIIARIISYENSLIKPFKGSPRMYVINGKPSCDNWTLINTGVGSDTVYNVYPLTHHLDSLTTPTLDILFSVPQRLYYVATAYTTQNAYIGYYDRFVREVLSRDGKLLTASFNVNINDFNLRRSKMIDGVLYRVNKITDFNCHQNEPTLIELIKVIDAKNRGRIFQIGLDRDTTPTDISFLDMEPNNDFSAPIGTGKFRFQIDSTGSIKVTNDLGVTKSASGVKYEFDGKISQTGTSAPTIDATGINTLPSTITPTRTGVGTYRLTSVGSFSGVCTIQITNGNYNNFRQIIEAVKASDNIISINTYDLSAAGDAILTNASINIKVY